MARKVRTAEQLEELTPAEQDALFESLISDLDEVPADFLDRVRRRLEARITAESADSH